MSRNKIRNKLPTLVISALFFSTAPFSANAAAAPVADYTIKLHDGDASALKRLGVDARLQFEFAQGQAFKNIYSFRSGKTLTELTRELAGAAEYVQENHQFEATTLSYEPLTANDPGFTANPLNIDKQWAIPLVGFDYAWSKTTGNAGNIVAVIDTGIDATHEDLQNLGLVPGYDFINNQNIVGRVNSDDSGHGTLVAGILGASVNNGIGIVGANWSATVMPLKALDASGRGNTNTVAQAIVWAADHGASFINLSLGGVGLAYDPTIANAISYAFNRGVVIVAAAGNDAAASGVNLDLSPVYPVCNDNGGNQVIGVAASDQNDLKPAFSNYGSSCVDVMAPGKRILSTINRDPLTKAYAPNSYTYVSGTSLAVPYVTAEALLVKALYPSATNIQIRDQILATADSIDNVNLSQCGGGPCRGLLGAGRINARKALDKDMVIDAIQDGDLITLSPNNQVYQVVGNQKRPVSSFVLRQKFSQIQPKVVTPARQGALTDGPYVMPADGTLVKTASSPTVYYVLRDIKRPVIYPVFKQRGFDFNSVVTLPDSEVNTWVTGNLLPPSEGTIVRASRDRAMYWAVGDTLHAVNNNFYVQRKLSIFPVLTVSRQDLAGFPRGEAYVR